MLSEQLANAEAAEPAGQPDRWRRLLLVLLAISSAIVALSLLLPALVHHELTRDVGAARVFTFVGAEANLPTWWSASLLFGAALLHVQAGALARRSGIKGASAWWILAVLFAALSLDELTALHERLDEWGLALTDSGFAFPWLVLGTPIAIGIIAIALVAGRHLPRRSKVLSLAGLGLVLLSAVGLEAIGGLLLGDQKGEFQGENTLYTLVMHLEEFGEVAGAALAVCSPIAALQIRRSGAEVGVSLRSR